MMQYENGYPVTQLSGDAIAKMAIEEELRLIASKIDRLHAEIEARRPLHEEYRAKIRQMTEATVELHRARRALRRKSKCAKSKKDSSFWKRLKTSLGDCADKKAQDSPD